MFPTDARIPTPAEFARSVLDKRAWVASEIDRMQLAGDPAKEIKGWQKILLSYDKMISDYGLER